MTEIDTEHVDATRKWKDELHLQMPMEWGFGHAAEVMPAVSITGMAMQLVGASGDYPSDATGMIQDDQPEVLW